MKLCAQSKKMMLFTTSLGVSGAKYINPQNSAFGVKLSGLVGQHLMTAEQRRCTRQLPECRSEREPCQMLLCAFEYNRIPKSVIKVNLKVTEVQRL